MQWKVRRGEGRPERGVPGQKVQSVCGWSRKVCWCLLWRMGSLGPCDRTTVSIRWGTVPSLVQTCRRGTTCRSCCWTVSTTALNRTLSETVQCLPLWSEHFQHPLEERSGTKEKTEGGRWKQTTGTCQLWICSQDRPSLVFCPQEIWRVVWSTTEEICSSWGVGLWRDPLGVYCSMATGTCAVWDVTWKKSLSICPSWSAHQTRHARPGEVSVALLSQQARGMQDAAPRPLRHLLCQEPMGRLIKGQICVAFDRQLFYGPQFQGVKDKIRDKRED